jgi:phenylacetate-CoA ligase
MKPGNFLFGKIIIPSAYLSKGDLRFIYYSKYKKHLKMSKKQVKKYQSSRLKSLIRHAYNTVPYYRRLFDERRLTPKDIKSSEDLKKIPILTKDNIRDNLEDLKSKKKYKLYEATSGGSTGNRVFLYQDKRYKEMGMAAVLRDFYSAGINPGDKVAWIWGSPLENENLKHKFLHKALWSINRRIIFDTFSYTDEKLETWLKNDLNEFRPDAIYGYAHSIYEVAKFAKEKKIELPKIKVIVCSAQKLEHRDFIESVFKCPVIDQYGCREVPTIAIEDKNRVMHSSDDFVIVEVERDGRILLTPLESYGMPLLRYAVGDYGVKKENKKDNHPFETFSISIGRTTEILRKKTGEKVYPGKINLKMAEEKLDVGEFQLIQESYERVTLNVVRNKITRKEDVEKLKRIIKNTLGTKIIKVNYVARFPVEKSGKKIGYKCLIR